ncbi:acyl-CoA dehydrogenase family protein [Ruixingdingia sedimenti]|uniref:Acyl-CoA dehydrogenase family protein n=1 Tax=Ruixingdingia sedimenti TaxID=3073604 RepID=A0ABU1FF15_9RHOB|nr:acyl-CoA dehydrogenase family protein [Xinfangfangia sp. LG-4]MDR5655461.1 acyl-CoA dehydrogenase family protein [Xinfangfangia sp. LG-4]
MATANTMDYNAMDEGEFRRMLRGFIAAECPPHLIDQARRVRWHEAKDWVLKLSAKGWLAPAWPVEHGGMGLNVEKMLAYHDEFDSAGVARHPDIGIVMLGMLLVRFGTDAQKAHYLPRILSGQDIWCQGYSEPGAGSDLASLRTSAVLDGDHWVINGQKIWTTLAQDSTDIFVLVRTDPAAKKQRGISFLLARMDTPGITVRPIETLAGDAEFCEVFFDDVRVPKDNIVGAVNDGWTMAKALLGFERLTHGSPKFAQMALQRLAALARELGVFREPAFAETYARLALDVADLTATYARFAETLKSGGALGPEISVLKLWGPDLYQRISEVMIETAGEHGVTLGPSTIGGAVFDPLGYYFLSRPTTIYGGSNEIQRNILAKTLLGMPG